MIPIDNGEKKSGEKDSLLWSYGLECRAQQVIFRVGRTVSTPLIPPGSGYILPAFPSTKFFIGGERDRKRVEKLLRCDFYSSYRITDPATASVYH